jgi:hypothetical protein
MITIKLTFVSDGTTLTLSKTRFRHPLLKQELVTVRGSTAPGTAGNFRWSSGVRGLALLLVKHAIAAECGTKGAAAGHPSAGIEGDEGSLAASLDYAISKQPRWLDEMFGTTPQGVPISKLLFRRINPDRKRPGPVTVFIPNSDFGVFIEVNGKSARGDRELFDLERRLTALAESVRIAS